MNSRLSRIGTVLATATLLARPVAEAPAAGVGPPDAIQYAVLLVTADGQLQRVDRRIPDIAKHSVPISGLQHGELIHDIDIRPSDGELYGLTDHNRLVKINRSTGVVSVVGGPYGLTSSMTGIDFNPQVDRIRVVGGTQNLRLSPTTGAVVAVDGALAYASGDPREGVQPRVAAVAHAAHGGRSTLIGVDQSLELVRQGSPGGNPVSPNTGQVFTIGSLGLPHGTVDEFAGLDIAGAPSGSEFKPSEHLALSAVRRAGETRSRLIKIDLATGRSTDLGLLPGVVLGLAIG